MATKNFIREPIERIYKIVPDAHVPAGISLSTMLAKLGVNRVYWPESHRALALECMALMKEGEALRKDKQ